MGKDFSLISPETSVIPELEVRLLLYSLILGIAAGVYITVKYTFIKLLKPGKAIIAVCDFFTCIFIALSIFSLALRYNFGIIRWYIPAMSFAGFCIWKKMFHTGFEKIIIAFILPFIKIFASFKTALFPLKSKLKKYK